MNIAYLTNIPSNPADGGGNAHVHQLSKNLISLGHKLYTNLQQENPPFIFFDEHQFKKYADNIDVFYIRIHGNHLNDELTLLRKHNSKAPCIWEINSPLEEQLTKGVSPEALQSHIRRRIELAKLVDCAICVSVEMESYARTILGIKRTYVLPNGSDPELFKSSPPGSPLYDDFFRVLWSGSPKYCWQGHKIVEKVAAQIMEVDKSIKFILTLEGEANANTDYIGRVSYHDMADIISTADVCLCLYEQIDYYKEFYFSPLKLYDYMAVGKPVIGSDVGQIKYVIDKYGCGLLTTNEIDDIVAKIIYLKNHKGIANEIGTKGRDAILRTHNWSNIAIETAGIMFEAIKDKRDFINMFKKMILRW